MSPPPAVRIGDEGVRPQVAPKKLDVEGIERVYVWDLVVRATHWITMFAIFILAFTGIYIGKPFLIPTGSDPALLMATMKVVHLYTAMVFTAALVIRIYWMFAGSYYARWHQFVPIGKRRRGDITKMIKFYALLSKEPPLNVGHNPLAGLTYIAVYTLYVIMLLTGLALYSVSAAGTWGQSWDWLLVVFGGAQSARLIHHVAMWLILGFFAHHIWSAILVSRLEGMGLIDSMFSGYKFLPLRWRTRLQLSWRDRDKPYPEDE